MTNVRFAFNKLLTIACFVIVMSFAFIVHPTHAQQITSGTVSLPMMDAPQNANAASITNADYDVAFDVETGSVGNTITVKFPDAYIITNGELGSGAVDVCIASCTSPGNVNIDNVERSVTSVVGNNTTKTILITLAGSYDFGAGFGTSFRIKKGVQNPSILSTFGNNGTGDVFTLTTNTTGDIEFSTTSTVTIAMTPLFIAVGTVEHATTSGAENQESTGLIDADYNVHFTMVANGNSGNTIIVKFPSAYTITDGDLGTSAVNHCIADCSSPGFIGVGMTSAVVLSVTGNATAKTITVVTSAYYDFNASGSGTSFRIQTGIQNPGVDGTYGNNGEGDVFTLFTNSGGDLEFLTSSTTTVSDVTPPTLLRIDTGDLDGNGLDKLTVTFSENIKTGGDLSGGGWGIVGSDSGGRSITASTDPDGSSNKIVLTLSSAFLSEDPNAGMWYNSAFGNVKDVANNVLNISFMSPVDIQARATHLVFTQLPFSGDTCAPPNGDVASGASVTSGCDSEQNMFQTDVKVEAKTAGGATDITNTDLVTLALDSDAVIGATLRLKTTGLSDTGVLTANMVAGVATFHGLRYYATEDHEHFNIAASADGLTSAHTADDIATLSPGHPAYLVADVTADRVIFTTMPSDTGAIATIADTESKIVSGIVFETQPILQALDAQSKLDLDGSAVISLSHNGVSEDAGCAGNGKGCDLGSGTFTSTASTAMINGVADFNTLYSNPDYQYDPQTDGLEYSADSDHEIFTVLGQICLGITLPAMSCDSPYYFHSGNIGADIVSTHLLVAVTQTLDPIVVTAGETKQFIIAAVDDESLSVIQDIDYVAVEKTFTLKDVDGNLLSTHVSAGNTAPTLPTNAAILEDFATGDGGQTVNLSIVLTKPESGLVIYVSDGTFTGVSNSITVRHGNIDHFAVTTTSSTPVGGTAISFTVDAVDSVGNILDDRFGATPYTGTISIGTNATTPYTLAPYIFTFLSGTNGAKTFSSAMTFTVAESSVKLNVATLDASFTGESSLMTVSASPAATTTTIVYVGGGGGGGGGSYILPASPIATPVVTPVTTPVVTLPVEPVVTPVINPELQPVLGVTDPLNFDALLKTLGTESKPEWFLINKGLTTTDAKEFNVAMNSDQTKAVANFITYGISEATKKLGAGERRALERDYLETVGRADIVWEDVERLATGQKPVKRNLPKEQTSAVKVLADFKKMTGHAPNFKDTSEDIAWNTLMYRIRFSRDLVKEQSGIVKFKKIFKRNPSTPFEWAEVRALGYALK